MSVHKLDLYQFGLKFSISVKVSFIFCWTCYTLQATSLYGARIIKYFLARYMSDPKEQLLFSKPRRNLLRKINILSPVLLTFESVTRHAFRKREIDVNKEFTEVPKLKLV